MTDPEENEGGWGSRRTYLMVLLAQLINMPLFITVPNVAIMHGATGYMLCYVLCSVVIGIPLLYMEFIISQFTARDCIDVWKVRPCLSYIGYIQILWQVFSVISNHINVSFTLHYLLISFESPVPYYTCGSWATKDCNILKHNYSVNEDCLRLKKTPYYCDFLHTTFPEFQFWKYNILSARKQYFTIAWQVCLASGVSSAMVYLSCFKRKQSVMFVIAFYTIFPLLGYMVLFMVSMLQKGVVMLYHEALDSDFMHFSVNFRLPLMIMQVVNNLGLGSGLMFNVGTGASFRTPCYSNTVVVVTVCTAASVLATTTTAIMTCPYSYEYGIKPFRMISAHMALVYEKMPRLLKEYQGSHFWVVLVFSSLTVLALSSNVIIIHHLVDVAVARSTAIAKYPGLTIFLLILSLYLLTIPFLSLLGLSVTIGLRRFCGFITTFLTFLEIVVFILWYGLDRFSEDVHFMLGIQPKPCMKIAWLGSSVILLYVLCYEIYTKIMEFNSALTEYVGWGAFGLSMVLVIGVALVKVVIAALRHKIKETVRLDPSWGPRDEVLQRSRAMFTAQAMTKEYLYRQYHLQAGILQRQKMSNCRN